MITRGLAKAIVRRKRGVSLKALPFEMMVEIFSYLNFNSLFELRYLEKWMLFTLLSIITKRLSENNIIVSISYVQHGEDTIKTVYTYAINRVYMHYSKTYVAWSRTILVAYNAEHLRPVGRIATRHMNKLVPFLMVSAFWSKEYGTIQWIADRMLSFDTTHCLEMLVQRASRLPNYIDYVIWYYNCFIPKLIPDYCCWNNCRPSLNVYLVLRQYGLYDDVMNCLIESRRQRFEQIESNRNATWTDQYHDELRTYQEKLIPMLLVSK